MKIRLKIWKHSGLYVGDKLFDISWGKNRWNGGFANVVGYPKLKISFSRTIEYYSNIIILGYPLRISLWIHRTKRYITDLIKKQIEIKFPPASF